MSSNQTPEEMERLRRAFAVARMVFPDDRKGKFFRDAAKRLAKCTGITYQAALDALQGAAVMAARAVAEKQMGGGE